MQVNIEAGKNLFKLVAFFFIFCWVIWFDLFWWNQWKCSKWWWKWRRQMAEREVPITTPFKTSFFILHSNLLHHPLECVFKFFPINLERSSIRTQFLKSPFKSFPVAIKSSISKILSSNIQSIILSITHLIIHHRKTSLANLEPNRLWIILIHHEDIGCSIDYSREPPLQQGATFSAAFHHF